MHASKALLMAMALLYNTDRLSITIAALRGVLSSHTIQIQIHNSVQKFALRVCSKSWNSNYELFSATASYLPYPTEEKS